MEDMTTEKKLQLVQQIRTRQNRNQYDLSARERILYGYTSSNITPLSCRKSYAENTYATNFTSPVCSDEKSTSESLKFRSALACMLLLFAILFDYFKIAPVGIEMKQIFQIIAADYQNNMTEFVETMTGENVIDRPSKNG